jgi:DNA helicase-2/ATP-dependent DNA helicase PcrA
VRDNGTEAGYERKEIAVLYRSNAQSRVIETALFNAAMPYRVYGGLRFFERAEIKHALAYLRLLENPNDDTSFMRVVNFPARGIGSRSLEQLQDVARTSGCSLHDAVSALTGRAGAVIAGFVAKMDILREQTVGLNLRDIIALVLDHSGLVAHYKADREGEDRLENLDELINAAESFVMQEGFGKDAAAMLANPGSNANALGQSPASQGLDLNAPMPAQTVAADDVFGDTGETLSPLVAFLTHAALEAGDNMAQAGQDAIQLMTVHSSKGLEFDAVFITGMEEGLFPHENSMNDRDGLEEERRLMYVAITRARKRLYLSHSQSRMLHGQTRFNMKSRFFDELPEPCLKWLTPKNQNFNRSWNASTGSTSGSGSGSAMYSGAAYAGSTRASDPFGTQNTPVARKDDAAHGLRVGMAVFHPKFGEGKVLTLEGAGDDARAQINFPRHGTKWLALSVAKLTPI